jgi:Domain of unknown function (DUF4266)
MSRLTILLASIVLLSGCSALAPPKLGAQPWQRGTLAQRCMRLDGYPLENALAEHTYFSKEASSGGAGFSGGGCGCN